MVSDPETWVVLRTKRTDIGPRQVFEFGGGTYRAITYPHGAVIEYPPGITRTISLIHDPDIYIPELGEIIAEPLFKRN